MAAISLADLPDFFEERASRCDPYIRAAVALQALGRKAACATLTALAADSGGDRIIVLCRMLFAARPGGVFRRPLIGELKLFGETECGDWPTGPVELVG